mmetsp:Transcript_20888/g.39878  ORF Transcript_20888/g.39878 Transcript_20888/m.39878 type:complete len:786 (+) Transcript_20888:114-2471(+)
MTPSVIKEKTVSRVDSRGSRGIDSSNASTIEPTSVTDLRMISGVQSEWSLWEGHQRDIRQFSGMTNETVTGDRLMASTGHIPDRLLGSASTFSSTMPDRLMASSSGFGSTNFLGSASVIGEHSMMSDDDRHEKLLVQRSSSHSLGPTYEGGKYVHRRRQGSRTPSSQRARSPVRDLVVRVGLSHMFRMSELVRLGDMLQDKGYRTVESMKYLDEMTVAELGIPDRLARSLQHATGAAPWQKFGRVQPLPPEEPYLETVEPGSPNQYKKKAYACEMDGFRDLPSSVDSMNGFPSALRDYAMSPEREARLSPTYNVRRERSVEVHIDRQVSARTARQESQERSPVRDAWMESSFNRKGGCAHFGSSSVRSIAGYDNPARCRQLAGEVAPTLSDRGRFSWLQDQERSMDDVRNLRDKVWSVASSPPPRMRSCSARSSPNLGGLDSPKNSVSFGGGRTRPKTPVHRREIAPERDDYIAPEVPQMPQGMLFMPTRSQEDGTRCAETMSEGSLRTGGGSLRTAGGSIRTGGGGSIQGGSLRTPRTFTPYEVEGPVSPKSGPSTATEPATVWTPASYPQLPQVVPLNHGPQYGQSPYTGPRPGSPRPQAAEQLQMAPWLASPAQVAELLQSSLMGFQKNAPQSGPRYISTPKSDLSTATPPSTPARSSTIQVVHPPSSLAAPMQTQTMLSPRASNLKQRPSSVSTTQMLGGVPTQVQPQAARPQSPNLRPQSSPRVHPGILAAGSMHSAPGTVKAPLGAAAPLAASIQQPMMRGRTAASPTPAVTRPRMVIQ